MMNKTFYTPISVSFFKSKILVRLLYLSLIYVFACNFRLVKRNGIGRFLDLNDLEDWTFVFEDGGNGSVKLLEFKQLGKGSIGTVLKTKLACTKKLACNWKWGNIGNGLKYNISEEQELDRDNYLLAESENSDYRTNLNSTEVAIKIKRGSENNRLGLHNEYKRLCAIYNAAPDYVVKPLGLLHTPDKASYAYLMPIYKGDIRLRGVFKNADEFVGCIDRVFIGIRKIHNEGFIHGDLKTKNIFVNDNNQCFIADPYNLFSHRFKNPSASVKKKSLSGTLLTKIEGNGKDSLGFLRARLTEFFDFLDLCTIMAKKIKWLKRHWMLDELRYYKNRLITEVVNDNYLKNIFEFNSGLLGEFMIKTEDYSDKDKSQKANEAVDMILKHYNIGVYLQEKLMEEKKSLAIK